MRSWIALRLVSYSSWLGSAREYAVANSAAVVCDVYPVIGLREKSLATKEDVSLLGVSGVVAMQTLATVKAVSQGTLTGVVVAGHIVNRAIFSHYVDSLKQNLSKRRVLSDDATKELTATSGQKVLMDALKSEDTLDVLSALELAHALDDVKVDNRVESLLTHPAAPPG